MLFLSTRGLRALSLCLLITNREQRSRMSKQTIQTPQRSALSLSALSSRFNVSVIFIWGFGFSTAVFELSNFSYSLNTRLWCITIIYPRIRCVRLDEKRLWSKNSVLRLESAEHKLFSEQIKLRVSPDDRFHSVLFVLKVLLGCYSGRPLKGKVGQSELFQGTSLISLCGHVLCKPCGREQIKDKFKPGSQATTPGVSVNYLRARWLVQTSQLKSTKCGGRSIETMLLHHWRWVYT